MKKNINKFKTIRLIIAVIAIAVGFIIFTLTYNNYQKVYNLYKNSNEVEGYVYNVRKLKNNNYQFEYKYNVQGDEYKTYISKMAFDKELNNDDKISVYYNKTNPTENIIDKPDKNSLYIAITFLVVFLLIGIINIYSILKK